MNQLLPNNPALGHAVLRVGLGTMWISHAMLKLMVYTMPGTAQFFASQGFPAMLAYPVVAAEVVGGIAIIFGYYGRVVSLLLLPILLGAIKVHAGNGWLFTNAQGGWEYPVFLVLASVVHILAGDGAYAMRRAEV